MSTTPQQVVETQTSARQLAKLYRIALVERGDSFIFARRLEYNIRANTWLDLKTGECGCVKGTLALLLSKFFPQLTQEMSGGPQ